MRSQKIEGYETPPALTLSVSFLNQLGYTDGINILSRLFLPFHIPLQDKPKLPYLTLPKVEATAASSLREVSNQLANTLRQALLYARRPDAIPAHNGSKLVNVCHERKSGRRPRDKWLIYILSQTNNSYSYFIRTIRKVRLERPASGAGVGEVGQFEGYE